MNIVSIALFGEGYDKYLPAWVLAFLNLFPQDTWRLRVHCDNAVRREVVIQLSRAGLIDAAFLYPTPLCKAMLWRMAPVFETIKILANDFSGPPSNLVDVKYVFCRDLDCLPMPRDRAAMEQFILAGATVHTIHDSDQHMNIMGGLCGFHVPSFKTITGLKSVEQIYAHGDHVLSGLKARAALGPWDHRGADQIVLNNICLRTNGPVLFEHRYNGWSQGPRKKTPRSAGVYPCHAYSTPVPNVGTSSLTAKDLQDQADLLADHLGAPGFDHKAAWSFWSEHGDPKLAEAVKACL